MKRIFVFAFLLALLLVPARLIAQQDSTAAAERELAEERHRSITKRLTELEESIAAFQKNVTALRDELRRVKDDMDRLKNKNESAATHDSIKLLAEKIEEVDRKRAASDERNIKAIEEIGKAILNRPLNTQRPAAMSANPAASGAERPRTPAANTAPNTAGSQAGWKYKIRAGDNPSRILKDLKQQRGINLTLRQLLEANPGVNWNNLQIGQEIFIPQP